jgi:hypothetical protein
MSEINKTFIKVSRVLKSEDDDKSVTRPETIDVKDIKYFRPWHKGKTDNGIDGDITLLVVSTNLKDKDGNVKLKKMLINENYETFEDRLGEKVVVKK